MTDFSVLLLSTIALSCPLILAAMGGWASERGGVVNIALEGKMLIAAAMVAIVGAVTGNAVLGLTVGLLAAVLLSWLHFLLTQNYRIDPIVSGMAVNALALGFSNFLDQSFNQGGKQVPLLPIQIYYVLAALAPIALYLIATRTRDGLRLIAVGNDPDKARQMGIHPLQVRFLGLTVTGLLCGLAGALLVTNIRNFTDGMTAGRGYIALAALILGGWRPIPAAIACIGFGFFSALQIQFQGAELMGIRVMPQIWNTLPYVATLIALAGFLGRNRAPAGLGKV